MLLFIDGHNEGIFNWKNLLRYTDTNISSVCLYVFDNFPIAYLKNYIACFDNDDNEKLHLSMIQKCPGTSLLFLFALITVIQNLSSGIHDETACIKVLC
jgi:hypothetical protein